MSGSEKICRAKWIDVAKCLAILAVMTDHVGGLLYSNINIAYLSYYSVSVFILVMGITTYWSFNNSKESLINKVKRKSIGILRPYFIATLIYCLIGYKSFELETYLNHIIHFNASGPLYYILLYIQLVLISPILYRIIKFAEKKHSIILEISSAIGILILASLSINYTNIFSVYGGGGKLFGGTYLFLLYLGMLFGKYIDKIHLNRIFYRIAFLISCVAIVGWYKFITVNQFTLDQRCPFGMGLNPPGVTLCVYAVLVVITIFLLEKVIEDSEHEWSIYAGIACLGKHTLYIFLYHRLFLDYVLVGSETFIDNIWVKRVLYFLVMIVGSILIEIILEKIHQWIVYTYVCQKVDEC